MSHEGAKSQITQVGHVRSSAKSLGGALTLGLVRATAQRVAAAVEHDSGLPLDVSELSYEIVNKRSAFVSKILQEAKATCGLSEADWNVVAPVSETYQRNLGRSLAAAYVARDRVVLLSAPTVVLGTYDDLGCSLYHQLVHAAQHQNFPSYWGHLTAAVTHALSESARLGEGAAPAQCARERALALMVLLEGHPMVLQQAFAREHFPLASATAARGEFMRAMLPLSGVDALLQEPAIVGTLVQLAKRPALMRRLYELPDLAHLLFAQHSRPAFEIPNDPKLRSDCLVIFAAAMVAHSAAGNATGIDVGPVPG